MSIALTGVAGFWTRFGKLAKTWIDVDTLRAGDTDTRITALAAQYLSNEQDVFADIWPLRDSWRGMPSPYVQGLFTLAGDTLLAQADRDTVLPSRTVAEAVKELIRQMVSSSDSLNKPTITSAVNASGSNTGDTTLVTTTTDGDAKQLDCLFAETVTARVITASAQAQFSESIQFIADPAANPSDYNWPAGSGTTVTATTTDPANQTLVANGGFETWTVSNVPDNWTIDTGTAGVDVLQGSSPRRGTYNLRLVADGATLVKLSQAPAVTLSPLTLYAVTVTVKISATTATGVLRLALVDDTLGSVVNDAAGNANSTSLSLNGGAGVGTTYTQFTAWFRTPAKASADWRIEIGFTTAPTAGRLIDIDLLGVTTPTQLYAGGPWVQAWGNSVTPIVGDSWSLPYTNSLGTDSLVRSADRAFGTRQLGVKFPTNAVPTISDGLIV